MQLLFPGTASPYLIRLTICVEPIAPRVLSRREKKKVNCKPKNLDEQEIPFRLREIMKSRQEMKKPLSNKRRKKEGMYRPNSWVAAKLCVWDSAPLPKYLMEFQAEEVCQDPARRSVRDVERSAEGQSG